MEERQAWVSANRHRCYADTYQQRITRPAGPAPLSKCEATAFRQLKAGASDSDVALLNKLTNASGLHRALIRPDETARVRELARAYCRRYGAEPGGPWGG